MALLQLPEHGKARLIPVCILIDGKFYDAGIYKANPVPMALEGGTVYEGQRTGQPLGLFTVKGVLQQQQTKAWVAEGDWELAGAAPKKSTALPAEVKPREAEDKPPTLRRPGKTPAEAPSKPAETKPTDNHPAETKPSGNSPPSPPAPQSGQSTGSTGSVANTPSSTDSIPPASSPSHEAAEENDPSRPHLRRGVPPATRTVETSSSKSGMAKAPKPIVATTTPKTSPAPSSAAAGKSPALIPAISDAEGPEPRPYTFDLKPEEEQTFRKKILALAVTELARQVQQPDPASASQPSRKSKASTKPSAPSWNDVQLHVFDVATNNEPILVLSAKAMPAASTRNADEPAREYYVTVVARSDYNAELRKLFASVTDNQHLDVTPRLELIDAVDADGDGRGELLFREVWDTGVAYVVYRVTPDQLWALFEGTPGH